MKTLYALLILAVLSICSGTVNAYAEYAENIPYAVVQPNGDTLRCYISGDEYYQRLHDSANYTIIQNADNGWYVYAALQDGRLIPTPYIPGQTDPRTVRLTPGLADKQQEAFDKPHLQGLPHTNVSQGNLRFPVISIRFQGEPAMRCAFHNVDSIFNDTAVFHVSVTNYFKQASYDKLHFKFDFYPSNGAGTGVIASVQDMNARGYYLPKSTSNPSGYDPTNQDERRIREMDMLERAINSVKANIDTSGLDTDKDGIIDGIIFLMSGGRGKGILWPHKWALYDRTLDIKGLDAEFFAIIPSEDSLLPKPNTISHETFHILGAPDLYHNAPFRNMQPVGKWDLMERNLNPPQQMGAHMKEKYGKWCTIPEITREGMYYLHPLTSAKPDKIAYRIKSENKDESFILEYRNKKDLFDSSIPESGLLIYRIDARFNGNNKYDSTKNILDEVYIYRPITSITPSYKDELDKAWYPGLADSFNLSTNPRPELSDHKISKLRIEHIAFTGDSLQFYYGTFKDHMNADFSANRDTSASSAGKVILVKDHSTSDGQIVDREWKFEGGTPRKVKGADEVKVYYKKPGTYRILLSVSNTHKTDTITRQVVIP